MKVFACGVVMVLLTAGPALARPVALSVPTMMPWGMFGTAAAMGLSGVYFLLRRKK
jgi:hypothetical protein